ncbi:isopentenyl-diphosphate Delta-isomerase [Allonocardiopsis opalescens]|uniref:Isopentenyl-diphosphate Delta-isomerase n=1 Tax=Allonocardiopsis opalescens TaxID=1144618 RepID=A0A2T0QEB7_9ACTN|nr:isopentenyl-diphosphate Delta-isomerase [Allonocardiopsis opalescens]PRY02245.1 isopentenyl-diphosphate delta-isomerase [Allonocardiopsis opalescens]
MSAPTPRPAAEPTKPAEPVEYVVLLDADGRPAGRAAKSEVHHRDTPLHLAFSCYIFDRAGRLLVTRRALGKAAWPGVWTNSCCGHPAPGEAQPDAVRRRVAQELGLVIGEVRELLPDFAYRAVDASGVVENEVCPVFAASAEGDPRPDPGEVMDWRWVRWPDFVALAASAPWALSPWAVLQTERLRVMSPDPGVPTGR